MEHTVPPPPPGSRAYSPSEFDLLAANALRVAERFCTHRTRCKPDEMMELFQPTATLITVNNVVFGLRAIWAALEDGQRFTHLTKWYTPWRICANTLDYEIMPQAMTGAAASERPVGGLNPNIPKIVTVEREGRIFTGLWFWDPRHMRVRETCVVEDGRIKVFATQRKF